MYKYPKINGLWARDMETHELLVGEFRDPVVRFTRSLNWMWHEKIDGTNIGVVWDGYRVSFQGRTERAEIPAPLLKRLNELFGGPEKEDLFEQKFGEMPVILYGEGYGGKIQGGKAYSEKEDFILFDVYLPNDDLWLSDDDVTDVSVYFGIRKVPLLFVSNIEYAVERVRSGELKSDFPGVKIEGVVGRPLFELRNRRGQRLIVKVKGRDYK